MAAAAGQRGEIVRMDDSILHVDLQCPSSLSAGGELEIQLTLESSRAIENPILHTYLISTRDESLAFGHRSDLDGAEWDVVEGRCVVTIRSASLPLRAGRYWLTVTMAEGHPDNVLFGFHRAHELEVTGTTSAQGAIDAGLTYEVTQRR